MEKDVKLRSEGSKTIPLLTNGADVCKKVTFRLLKWSLVSFAMGIGFSGVADLVKNYNNKKIIKAKKGGNNEN